MKSLLMYVPKGIHLAQIASTVKIHLILILNPLSLTIFISQSLCWLLMLTVSSGPYNNKTDP